MATLLMLDGFEHGRAAAGSAGVFDSVFGSPGNVTSPARTGARALEITATGSQEYVSYTIAAGNRVITQAVYIRFAALPTGAGVTDQLIQFVNSGGNGLLQYSVDDNQFRVTNGTNSALGGPTLAVDTWYRIVVEYDTSGANAVIRATVDGGTEFSASTARAAADTTAARLGTGGSQTYTAYYDDWLISVTDGDYEEIEGWTSHQIESLIPNSDGTHNISASGNFDSFTGTAFSNSTTNGNTFIGHRPLQAANTADQVIRQDVIAASDYMEFGLENLADNTKSVAGVRAYATHVESSATGNSAHEARLLLSDNTEVLTTGSLAVIDSSEDPGTTLTIRKRMTIAPSGGWDGTKVDGSKFRIGFNDVAADSNFIDLMLEVAQFVVAGDATATPSTVAATAAVPAPSAQGAAQTSPSTVAAVGAVPAPTARSDNTASPATVAATTAVPVPTARGAASTSPTTVAATASVPAPTTQSAAVTTPLTVAAIGAVPAPVASGGAGGDGTANPATVAAVAAIPASIARGAAIIGPTTVGAVAAVPAPIARGAARTTPAQVAAVAAVPAPTASSSGQANPVRVAAVTTVPAPTVRGAGVASPFTVAAIATIPAPSFPGLVDLVFITEGDADATSTYLEGDGGAAGSIEGDALVGAGLEG
jgi:hypothetical protein